MFCQECGQEIAEATKFCPHCGANTELRGTAQASPPAQSASTPATEMTFGKAIATCLSKYADFSGRAARPEYWWFYLFTVLLSWGAMLVDSSHMLSLLANLALLLPSLAAASRRLHDTNRSAWWMLIAFTVIGIIPLIIWLASKGQQGANEYGEPA